MKTPTPWANNDVKAPQGWTPATKSRAQWANNDVKTPSRFTAATKNTTPWGHTKALQTYFYDDPKFTYDSPLTLYNYLINGNTDNQRGQTAWRQVV